MKKFWAVIKKVVILLICVVIVALLANLFLTNVRQDRDVTEMWTRLDDRSAIIFKDKEHLASLERRLDALERKINEAGIRLAK